MAVLRLACGVVGMGGRRRIGRLGGGAARAALGRTVLLVPLATGAALASTMGNAFAACTLANGTYLCSGDSTSAVVLTDAGLSVVLQSSFTNSSEISSNAIDLLVTPQGGLSLTAAAGSVVDGHDHGIAATNSGIGATMVTLAGDVTGHEGGAVNIINNASAGDLTIMQTAGTITGHRYGIGATNSGSGNLSITQKGGSISGNIFGIATDNDGTGKTVITTAGEIRASGNYGLLSMNGATTTGQTITQLGGSIYGEEAGIYAFNQSAVHGPVITIAAGAAVSGQDYGIWVESAAGSVVNAAGSISGGSGAIYFENGGNTLNLYQTAVLSGAVNFDGEYGNTINFHSGSYRLAVSNFDLEAGSIQLQGAGQSLILSDLDPKSGSGDIVVVDTAAPQLGARLAGDFAGSTFGLVGDVIGFDGARPVDSPPLGYAPAAKPNPTEIQTRSGEGQLYDAYGNLVWLRGFAAAQDQAASGAQVGSFTRQFGLIGGIDHQYDDWRIGFFGGGGEAHAALSDHSGEIRGDIGLIGAYARYGFGSVWLDAVASGGYIGSGTTRQINGGSETATGSFGGWFAATELGLSTRYALGGHWSLTPGLKGRYTATVFDGYSETGSSQNITYDAHTVQGLEGRFEAKLAYGTRTPDGAPISYWMKGAVFARKTVGATDYSASVLGTDLTVAPSGNRNSYGGTLGLGMDVMLTGNASLFASIEGSLDGTHAHSGAAKGGVKLAF